MKFALTDHWLTRLLFVLLCMIGSNLSAAERLNVLLIADSNIEFHASLVESLRQRLQATENRNVVVRSVDLNSAPQAMRQPGYDLLVSVGTESTRVALAEHPSQPLYSVAIPRLSFDELKQRANDTDDETKIRPFSALYLDQPLRRRLLLIRELMPESDDVAVILGPGTRQYAGELKDTARSMGFRLHMGEVDRESELIGQLDRVLEKSDVMLGLADPVVFNRSSARNILLAAYRWRVPLIGISPSYVRAGALASVYSSPQQLGLQLAETLEHMANTTDRRLPAAGYPRYFDISINSQVAETLGIHLEDDAVIKHRFMNREGEQP